MSLKFYHHHHYPTTATPRLPPLVMYYIYCVYALAGGAIISIPDPYICAVSRVCANESHAVFHRPVVCAVKRSYRLHTSIEAYFVGGESSRTPEPVGMLRNNF